MPYPINTGPPNFVTPLKDRIITAGKVLNLNLPLIVDPDGNEIGPVVVVGLKKPYISGDFPNYKLKPKATDVGALIVLITLTDVHPETI